ncbi:MULTISPECIES: phage portal protein [unclassified Bacillus (in: firmicutes)]|uniref:phage portal protein n=1 Tax=unclassified Bacillus (in: firmicutes) TaxID=185979 RepID=UPI00227E5A52|nr:MULTISPECIES: phage portal protein [unclassified Bacillus (in: firmicutes)]MCY8061609.1 phage portal protein [Bacillus spizizenii]MDN0191175.1 phage portal protein [Bacillus sp. B.PNR1]MDN3032081.1 phage portal protein [Bacillus sp. B.PNR2]
MKEFINLIQQNGISGNIIKLMIEEHRPTRDKMIKLYARYKADPSGVPILTRKLIDYDGIGNEAVKRIDDKVNNKLNNSFDSEIIDTKTGYMFGHPITYETEDEALKKMVSTFNTRNNIEDSDSELGKTASICGYGARLLYVDEEGNERLRNVDPWEAIILASDDITEPTFGLRYYQVFEWSGETKVTSYRADFYDATYIYSFKSSDKELYQLIERKPHMFAGCPLFGVPNNKELKGDTEKVISLIDAYDRTLSDASNEIEQFRLAYLIVKGASLDEEDMENLKKSGVFEVFDENGDVKFLTKEINDTMIENHLNRLEENILRFAKTVNFSDGSFGGTITGVAMRYKLMALEHKAITMERKMTAAFRYQYKILCSAWDKKILADKDGYLKLWFQFKRNLPVNILEEAQASAQLKGQVSEETRLALLSFVDDVRFELERMAAERDAYDLEGNYIEEQEQHEDYGLEK